MKTKLLIGALVLVVGVVGGAYWWMSRPDAGPADFAQGNGRVEADLIDVATQLTGRVAAISVDEGDLVDAGTLLAEIDTETLRAQRARAEADVERARSEITQANAMIAQREAALEFAQAEFDRADALLSRNVGTAETVERRRSELLSARPRWQRRRPV
jgi:HlyD family secretion protein